MPNTTYGTPYAQSSDLVSNWPGVSLNVADRLDDVSFKGNGLNDQTGTSYTLVLTDAGKTVTFNNAGAVTVTIPTNASVAYETGTVIQLTNKGAGVVTVSPAGGVTLNNSSTLAQHASGYIQKLDTNTWVMVAVPSAGLTLITASTFSAVSSVSVNNCFSTTYDAYRVIARLSHSAGGVNLLMRLRASGSDTTTNYENRRSDLGAAYSTGTQTTEINVSAANLNIQHIVADFIGPNLAARTTHIGFGQDGSATCIFNGSQSSSTQFDGFTIYPVSGNITGTVRVYGYRNS